MFASSGNRDVPAAACFKKELARRRRGVRGASGLRPPAAVPSGPASAQGCGALLSSGKL